MTAIDIGDGMRGAGIPDSEVRYDFDMDIA
jgi:hypothetical protein